MIGTKASGQISPLATTDLSAETQKERNLVVRHNLKSGTKGLLDSSEFRRMLTDPET